MNLIIFQFGKDKPITRLTKEEADAIFLIVVEYMNHEFGKIIQNKN